jgi:lipoprotein-anchoring transpeptidase ErfK/SrfK
MLDRAGFSPGVIDGRMGANTRRALEAFRAQHGDVDPAAVTAVTVYTITEQDIAGPFTQHIPPDLVQQAALPALEYSSPIEGLAERFHTTPEFLKRLNPEARFAAGEGIQVPNVDPLIVPVDPLTIQNETQRRKKPNAAAAPTGTSGRTQANTIAARPDVVVSVSRAASALKVTDASGRVLFHAPVTTGSEQDPLPIGEWKVNGFRLKPVFHYNPDLFWDADPAHSKAKLAAGPNNPVGLVWIDLSKDHYGIHGTSEPSTIGRTMSHGCVRMTNWDALKVASLVKPGTRVVFTE